MLSLIQAILRKNCNFSPEGKNLRPGSPWQPNNNFDIPFLVSQGWWGDLRVSIPVCAVVSWWDRDHTWHIFLSVIHILSNIAWEAFQQTP